MVQELRWDETWEEKTRSPAPWCCLCSSYHVQTGCAERVLTVVSVCSKLELKSISVLRVLLDFEAAQKGSSASGKSNGFKCFFDLNYFWA